jgi:hypothetical protein
MKTGGCVAVARCSSDRHPSDWLLYCAFVLQWGFASRATPFGVREGESD